MGDIVKHHPKMVRRWAILYIDRYLKEGTKAIEWAKEFFEADAIELIAEEAKKEMKKRGLRPK